MIDSRTRLGRLLLHAFLIGGAGLFCLPFVWMIGTSMMSEREMFRPGVHFLPERPRPRLKSPYLDDREYPAKPRPPAGYGLPSLWGFHKTTMLSTVRDRIEEMKIDNPEGFPDDAFRLAIFRGVWQTMLETVEPEKWVGVGERMEPLSYAMVTPQMVQEVLGRIRRRLCLGHVSIRTRDFQHRELAADIPAAEVWKPLTDNLQLRQLADEGRQFALVQYDFSRQPRWELAATLETPVSFDQIRTFTIAMRQDETWHRYDVTVECAGRKWQSDEPLYLGGSEWGELILKKWDPDRYNPYLPHPWVWLRQAEGGSSFDDGQKVRVVLTATRSTPLEAWYGKALANYRLAWKYVPMWRYAATSFALVALNIVLMVVSSSLAAYAFARLQWPGRDVLFVVLLGTLMIPHQVTLIPGFIIMKWLGWYNTLNPLWIGAAFGSAFSIFLLRQFMRGIPTDLEDAARIDGCGFLRIWWHVMVPLVKPTLAAIAVFTFVGCWNDFMTPLIYLNDQRLYPLSLGLFQLQTILGANYAMMMAGSIIMTMPVIAVFFCAQKYFVQGITLTGMKA
jgi:multiple sugar transport system permease protein